MEIIEKTGPTVEAAVQAGLEELGVGPGEVLVEVLEEPNRGLLGIGAKPARVRIILIGGAKSEEPPQRTSSQPLTPLHMPKRETQRQERRDGERTPRRESRGEDRRDGGRGRRRDSGRGVRPQRNVPRQTQDTYSDPATDELPDMETDEDAREGKQILIEMLEKLGMAEVHVGIRRAEPTREGEQLHWILNISGKNVNRLIGRRGETLAAMQYLVRLIVSRRRQSRANLIVDVAQYKDQRSDRLEELAHRMADRAIDQNRTVTLEPMPPHERRIIHLALRERDDVTTESTGEGETRKVTITPVE